MVGSHISDELKDMAMSLSIQGQWRPRHHLHKGFLPPPLHLAACEHSARLTCRSTPLDLPLTHMFAGHPDDPVVAISIVTAGPLAPATVTTSPQPRHHYTHTCCPSTPPPRHGCNTLNPTDLVTTTASTPPCCHHLDMAFPLPQPRHLDMATTASTLLRHFHQRRAPQPAPVLSRHSPPPRPHYDAPTSAAHLDPHQRYLDTAPTAASMLAPPTHSPRFNPTPSALHARSPVRQAHIPRWYL
ncbi:hypothetical protein EDB92DRAFT_1953781 [Lactarius akahatsu]|uniref:Uncharacterized protein n=1 Tax=Lactarius akahatsu TaxID=416441 RepID=A0AAD4L576_9AGAM|nr:hypothetical protein EDB92DRAFT_1953781 [Lactarius akahatsu]